MQGPAYNRKTLSLETYMVYDADRTWTANVHTYVHTPYRSPKHTVYAVETGTVIPFYAFTKRANGRWVLKGKAQTCYPYIDLGEDFPGKRTSTNEV